VQCLPRELVQGKKRLEREFLQSDICRGSKNRGGADETQHPGGCAKPVKTYQNFLRYVLWADAISCLGCGILQVALNGPLSSFFGLSENLLMGTGVFLLVYGLVVAFLATRTQVPIAILGLLIVGNIMWGVLAVAILLSGDARITLLGKGYVTVQALTVLILAQLQYFTVRQIRSEVRSRGSFP
jgi:hypothetical protein